MGNSLILSKIYSFSTACNFSKDVRRFHTQKENFSWKTQISTFKICRSVHTKRVFKTYGFDPLTLFKSLGNQDVEIIIKILESQGLQTLSSIFVDILKVNLLFQKDANITGQNNKKKKKKKSKKQDQSS